MRLFRFARNDTDCFPGGRSSQNGYILLPVVLLVTLVAAVAWMLSGESALEGNITSGANEAAEAHYVAEAGLNHALVQTRTAGCGPYTDLTGVSLGAHSYTTTLTTNLGATSNYTLSPDQDAWIRSDQPTSNKGTDARLHIRFQGGIIERPLFRFDLSSLPANASVLSATAWFYVKKNHPEGPANIHALTAAWTETDATWDSMGGNMDSTVLASIPAQPDNNAWVSVDLTVPVQAWANGQPNYGIALDTVSEGVHGEYHSREQNGKEPYIEVVVGSPPTTASLQATGTLDSGVSRTISRDDVALYQHPPGAALLQPDAAAGEDAEIWKQSPDNNYGDATETWVSSATNDTTRTLLRFDMGALPYGAKILGATLSLQRQSGSGADQPVSAHRIREWWSEGSVTWNRRYTGVNWNTAGGDFDETAVATTPVGPANQRYEWDITPLAQGWVDGSYPNYGIMLVAAVAGMAGERFHTSDDADPTRWPSLGITYACECDTACIAPQGSGRVAMVGNYAGLFPDPRDQEKEAIMETWGYDVTIYDDNFLWLLNPGNYDVVYISETAESAAVGTQLTGYTIGVVNEQGNLNDELEMANGMNAVVGSIVDITDNSHYITALFAQGLLPVYSADMELLTTATPEAAGLQRLAEVTGAGSLVVLDNGAPDLNNNPVAGRRVTLPLGRGTNSNFNWTHLNNNGRLVVQRALQWGTGNTGGFCAVGNFRDEFGSNAFDNNSGSLGWAGDWIELDSSGSGAGSGKARVTGGELRLNGTPSGDDPSLARELDLSAHLSATLTFDYRTGSGIDADDSVVVEVSGNGGSSWTVLEDFINEPASSSGSRSYEITDYIAADTQVRFRVNDKYGGPSEYFYVDNLDIAAGCTPPPSPTGPIAHWKLDEIAGTTAVDSEGGHDGTLTNGPVWTTGKDNGALEFDGANDYVDLTSDTELDDVFVSGATVMAWIYLDSWGESSYGRILDKSSATSGDRDGWMIGTDGSNQTVAFAQGFTSGRGFWRPQANTVNLNEWVHIAYAYDASSTANDPVIYLNGVAQTSLVEITPSGTIRSDADINLRMGNHAFSTSRTLDGKLDDVRIYDRMLDATEIADIIADTGGGGGDYLDQFNAVALDGSDGSLDWSGMPWQEVNDNGSPASGNIRVESGVLHIDNLDGGSYEMVTRQADLGSASTAVLTFDYTGFGEGGLDTFAVDVSDSGGSSWVTLENIDVVGTASGSRSYDLQTSISLNTDFVLRFRIVQGFGGTTQHITFDNVRIDLGGGGGGGGGGGPAVLEVRVATGNDDAEERVSSGSVSLTSTDLELISDGGNAQLVGMRFTGVAVPAGATISNAWIQFQVDETNSGDTTVTIQGEASDSALQFTTSSNNISSRGRTTAQESWTPAPWTTTGDAGADQRTPDISTVVQEIVNRPGWTGGNDMVLIITGSGERTAESYNGSSAGAPLLHIEY